MKILIVEDEALIAESLFQLLSILEYQPYRPVSTPAEAIHVLENNPPDLVLLDLTLKNDLSGLDVAAYIQQQRLKIPFIVLTSNSDASMVAQVKKFHPASYLIKPFMRESLFAAIEIALPEEEEEENIEEEIMLKTGNRSEILNLRELIYLKANGKYTELHFSFGKRLVRLPLSSFIKENNSVGFLRVHKTYAVNPTYITAFAVDELIIGGNKIPIGRFFMPAVNNYLKSRGIHRKELKS